MAFRAILLLLACSRALAIARSKEGPQLTDEDTQLGPRRAGARLAGPRNARGGPPQKPTGQYEDTRPGPRRAGARFAEPQNARAMPPPRPAGRREDPGPRPPRKAGAWPAGPKTKEKLLERMTSQHEEQLWEQQRQHRRETAELLGRLEKNKKVIQDAEEAHARVRQAMSTIVAENKKVMGQARASEVKASQDFQHLQEENYALKERTVATQTKTEELTRQMRERIKALEDQVLALIPLQEQGRASAESAMAIQKQVRHMHQESRANAQLTERVISRAESLVERLRAQNAELSEKARVAEEEAAKLRSKVEKSLLNMRDFDDSDRKEELIMKP